jgi:hypothetical protein
VSVVRAATTITFSYRDNKKSVLEPIMRLEVSKGIDGFPRPSMVPPYRNRKAPLSPVRGFSFACSGGDLRSLAHVSEDGLIYHYPKTNRPGSRDAGEVAATPKPWRMTPGCYAGLAVRRASDGAAP